MTTRERNIACSYAIARALALSLLVSLAVSGSADGQVPGTADFAACNEAAPAVIKAGAASPTLGDQTRADQARSAAAAPSSLRGKPVESSDPQIHGMSAEGALDPTYQAAYRSCMRRRGF